MKFKMATSLGGIPIAVSEMTEVESACVGFWFPVGSRYETPKLQGVFHFIEHMLFKGTRKRTARAISEAIEGVGGRLNAFTTEEATCYYASASISHLGLVFDVLLDMVENSRFAAAEIQRERGVILEEIKMYEDQPAQVAQERLNGLLWPNHPLGQPIIGTSESVGKMTRAELFACYRAHYDLSRMVVTVAGKTTLETVQGLLGKRSGHLKPKAMREVPLPSPHSRPAVAAYEKKIEQTHLALGWPTISHNDRRRPALKLMNVILGENMSSRLFQEVRETHGLAYSIGSDLSFYKDTGSFTIGAGVKNKKTLEALAMIVKTVEALGKKAPSRDELHRAREYVIGQMRLNLENTENRVMWAGNGMISHGSVLKPQEEEAKYLAVTPKDIQAVAAQFLRPRNLKVAAVGPAIKASEIEKTLHL